MSNKSWLRLLGGLVLAALLIPIGWLVAARALGVPIVPATSDAGLLVTIGGVCQITAVRGSDAGSGEAGQEGR